MLKQHFQNSIFDFVSKLPLMPWKQIIQTQNMNHLLVQTKQLAIGNGIHEI